MNYADVMAYLQGTGRSWWCGRFYKNYNGLLDAYITFSDSTRYYHFIMEYDPEDVQIGENYGGYPTPAHFYLAKRAIRTGTSWTIAEYNAIQVAIPSVPAAIAAAAMGDDNAMDIDAAMNDAAMNDATINEAATDIDTVTTIDQAIQGSFLFLFEII